MKKIIGLMPVLLAASLLATVNTGCSDKAKLASHLQKASRYFDAGDYAQAELEYMNALRNDHLNATAIGRLGTIYFNQGRLVKAAPFLLKGSQLATNDLDLHLKLGSFYVVAGNLKAAHTEADFVLARRPQDSQAPLLLVSPAETPETLEATRARLQALSQKGDSAALQVALGSIAFRNQDFKTAEAAFKRAQTLDAKSGMSWSALGALYLAQTNLAQAESALKKAAELAPARSQEKIQYAEYKWQTGDLPGAKRILEEMVKKTPDYIPAWMVLIKVAAAEKQYDQCADLLTKVLTRDPDNFNALMSSGQLQIAQGKIAEATAEYERMAKIYPQAPAVHYQLAVAYLAGHESDKAVASLSKAVNLDPGFSEAILLLAQVQIKNGNVDPAIISLKKMAQKYPQFTQVQLLLADAYRAQGSRDAALAIYRQLEAAYPTNSGIPLLRGITSLEQQNNAAARKAFTKALEIAPDNFLALEQLVKLDIVEQQYAVALQRVQAQLLKNPELGGLRILQAQIFLAQGDSKQAEAALLKLVESKSDNDLVHMLLARVYMDAKQNQKALDQLKMAAARNPKNEDALLFTGIINNDEKDYKAARDAYEKLLLLNPQSSPALNNLAYLYSEYLLDLGRAYELAKRARELLPNDPSAADTLGWILCKRGQYASAVDLLQDSASQLPGEPEAQFHLGWALYMSGQESAAQLAFQRALQSGKEFRGKDECNQCLAVLVVNTKTAGADAVASLEKRVAAQPGDLIAWLRLATIYQRDGAADKAISAYESALKVSPKNISALINLAQLYAAKKNPQKAVEMAKAAYKLTPENQQVSLILGRLAYETGDHKLSFSLLQEAARNESRNPEVLFDLARAAYAMGQVPDAEAAARSALQTAPAFSRAEEAKRFLSMAVPAANSSSAGAQAQEILKAEPDYVPALMVVAAINEQKKDASAAKQIYKKVLSLYPNFAPAQRNLAILYAQDASLDAQAYDSATKARSAYPDDPIVAKALGIIFYQQSDFAKSEKLLKESADKLNNDPEIYFYLGMAQYKLKKSAECKASLQQALKLNLPAKFTTEAKRVLAEMK